MDPRQNSEHIIGKPKTLSSGAGLSAVGSIPGGARCLE